MRAHLLRLSVFLTALAAFGVADSASSDVIVQNFSFEADVLPVGGTTLDSITDWFVDNTNGSAGAEHPTAGVFNAIPDGVNVAYTDGGVIAQPLVDNTLTPAVLNVGDTYTLTLDIAGNNTPSTFGGYRIQIFAGATLLAQKTFSLSDSPAGPGNFFTDTLSYTTSVIDSGLVGQQLSIRLGTSPILGTGITYFDDVHFTAVPEPSSIALLGVGVVAIAGARWRRRIAARRR